ncbi:hypothetical protein, partial [Rhodovulum strictum]|uniref:hypothetical protein n=1 Tax=Rhodovulum strictum TaxID=58314 RepID=UPI001B8778A4
MARCGHPGANRKILYGKQATRKKCDDPAKKLLRPPTPIRKHPFTGGAEARLGRRRGLVVRLSVKSR